MLDEVAAMQLSGATETLAVDDADLVYDWVNGLMTCDDHDGMHHFAVFKDGYAIACSLNAIECLKSQGLLPYDL